MIRVWQLLVEQLLNGGVGTLPLALVSDVNASRVAEEGGLLPWQVSFKGVWQVVKALASRLGTAEVGEIAEIRRRLREAIRSQRVGHRANRCEPRARKRRPQHYPLLNESRQDARSRWGANCCS